MTTTNIPRLPASFLFSQYRDYLFFRKPLLHGLLLALHRAVRVTDSTSIRRHFQGAGHRDYEFGVPIGTYRVRLDGKSWGNKQNLRCYFSDLDGDKKFWLSVFANDSYMARDHNVDFKADVSIGDEFEIVIGETKKHMPQFNSARRQDGPAPT